ncbi:arrestin domain-containing protein 4-like [Sabethes cyaneus]|uniref:arrestin domain-containing protein 4-like n=1 Tax=Sabethes cyaneus TaxID=53552 RepID=UPI00221E2BF5|nr:arrestin domain-containing protein 4-like [Sabethes cyaneus]
MTVDCEIRYDGNPEGIFFVGQTVTGTAVLQLSETETVNGVSVKIEGFTAVNWRGKRHPHGHKHNRLFSGSEEHLSALTYVVGGPQGPVLEIPPGSHTFKFACPLAATLPTSFEGQYGHVRYTITVVVERPSRQNTSYREGFTVLRQVNLNEHPSLWEAKKLELSKQFGWWIFKSDPLDISVEVPSTGYVPGQHIPVLVQWDNGSSALINGIRIKLFKNETYSATDPFEKSRTDTTCIAKIENRDAHAQGRIRFERNLAIPSTPPSTVSPMITISYELVVYIHISSGEIPEFTVPITIGTIPLSGLPPIRRPENPSDRPSADQPPSYGFKLDGMPSDYPPSKSGAPSTSQTTASGPTPVAPMASAAEELPPPSYEEAMNTTPTNSQQDDDESATQWNGCKPFIPKYPVYKFDGPGGSGQQ